MRPPEARGSALVGAIPALRADAPRFLVRSRAQLGDVFSFRVGPHFIAVDFEHFRGERVVLDLFNHEAQMPVFVRY
ncbi:MAG: hypothetical protein P8Y05_10255, partial [Deinococcales bacterium]